MELLEGALLGIALAIQFNPPVSFIGAVVGAALASRPERTVWAVCVGVAAWFLGDGMRILPHVLGETGELSGTQAAGGGLALWATLGVWAVGGALVGYAAPIWAGAYVGRRVTHGTGWLAAGAVAGAVSAALASLATRV